MNLRALLDEGFGTSDAYTRNLRSLGHSAVDVIANDYVLQKKWARENGLSLLTDKARSVAARRIPWLGDRLGESDWASKVLEAQLTLERPDVIYFQDLTLLDPALAERIRSAGTLIVGQIACVLSDPRYVSGFDLLLTSFPHYVARFRGMGIRAEYFRLGFEASVLARLTKRSDQHGVVFVGGILPVHGEANRTLESVAGALPLDFWGYGTENLESNSPLLRRYHGESWGLKMFDILHNSRIVINRHGIPSKNHANNCRLYEATGVGAFLLTDRRDNLGELFHVGTEVEDYGDARELIDKIRYFMDHEDERARIALAGQARTLRDHTYQVRMRELEQILAKYL